MRYAICFTACALAAALVVTGCGKSEEETAEKFIETSLNSGDTDVDVSLKDGGDQVNLTAKTEEGTVNLSLGESTTIPENFPKDVPVFPETKVLMTNAVVELNHFTIQGSVAKPVAEVSGFYKEGLPKEGWEQEQVFAQSTEMESLIYRKGDRILSVTAIAQDDGTTQLTLNTGRQ